MNAYLDHPDAFDWDLLRSTLADLRRGKQVNIPVPSSDFVMFFFFLWREIVH